MWRVRLSVAPIALLLALSARAGQQQPCTEPRVFEGAALNSIVLPYRYVGAHETFELQRAGRQIAALVHFEILFSLLRYRSVGGTDLVAGPGEACDVGDVIFQVTSRSGPGTLTPGHALIVTWGRLFEQGDQLYVQSYLRFLRRGEKEPVQRETISVSLKAADRPRAFEASLPTQAIAFPPRRISKEDLARVSAEFARTMAVRTEKSLDAPGKSIDFAADQPFPYHVTRSEGEWIWIQPMRGGPAGWVRARIGDAEQAFTLRRWLPELAYVDAIAGFMRLRVGVEASEAAAVRKAIDDGFTRFERVVPVHDAPVPYGLASAVRGFVAWQPEASERTRVADLFAETMRLIPEYAAARNLAAVTQPLRSDAGLDATSAAELSRELTGALALDPSDAIVLRNLDRLYQVYAQEPEWSPYSKDELAQRVRVVQSLERAGR